MLKRIIIIPISFISMLMSTLICWCFKFRARVRLRVSVGNVTAASQDWGSGFGPVPTGHRPQTFNPDLGERATEHGGLGGVCGRSVGD